MDQSAKQTDISDPQLSFYREDIDPLEIRGQFDAMYHQALVSARGGIDCGPTATAPGARQEFGDDSDVNRIIERSGVPVPRVLAYGEYDFEMTLQSGLEATRAANGAWDRLPAEVRERYRSWPAVLRAMASGELEYGEVLDGSPKGPPVGEKPPEAPKSEGA